MYYLLSFRLHPSIEAVLRESITEFQGPNSHERCLFSDVSAPCLHASPHAIRRFLQPIHLPRLRNIDISNHMSKSFRIGHCMKNFMHYFFMVFTGVASAWILMPLRFIEVAKFFSSLKVGVFLPGTL